MTSHPPWANGPFELIVHAESHLRAAKDFDRRIALISYDNAIEIAITTYLGLNPIQRGNRKYKKQDVEQWLTNYHTKLGFFDKEIESRGIDWAIEKSHIVWVHDNRNAQYHGGAAGGIPEESTLQIARTSALWIFSILFDVSDAESALEQKLRDQAPPTTPSREKRIDAAIDTLYGIIEVGEQSYSASELLFAADYNAYRNIGEELGEFDPLMQEAEDEVEP